MNIKRYYLQKAQNKILAEARKRGGLINGNKSEAQVNAIAHEVKGLLDAFDLINAMLAESEGGDNE